LDTTRTLTGEVLATLRVKVNSILAVPPLPSALVTAVDPNTGVTGVGVELFLLHASMNKAQHAMAIFLMGTI
jgi:hypothetical protein